MIGVPHVDGDTPLHAQLGAPTIKREGVTYLACRVCRATKLIAADPNGLSDPYVVLRVGVPGEKAMKRK